MLTTKRSSRSPKVPAHVAVMIAGMVFGTAALLAASTGSVLLTVANDAYLNEAGLARSATTLKAGDMLRTTAEGAADLDFAGSRVTLGHRTSAEVLAGALQLNSGYAHIDGALASRLAGHGIQPRGRADYQLVALAGRDYITVATGTLDVSGFAQPTSVKAGGAISFDPNPPQAPAAAAGVGIFGGGTAATVAVAAVVVGVSVGAGLAVTAATVGLSNSPTGP